MSTKYPFYIRLGAALLGQSAQLNSQPDPEGGQVTQQVNPQHEETLELIPDEPSTQSAKIKIWTSVDDDLPKYYEAISIRIGNKVIPGVWARVSDGDEDYYVTDENNRVIRDITHWSNTEVTKDNVNNVVQLKRLKLLIEENYIPLTQVIDFNKDKTEGYNQAIGRAAEVIEREIRRISKQDLTTQSATKNNS